MNINDIATLANKPTRLITKSVAFEALRHLINGLAAEDCALASQRLAELYSFFLQKITKPKTVEQWLTLALADKFEVRTFLRHVYSDATCVVATNAHRLHLLKINKYPTGFYDPALNRMLDMDDIPYPDFNRVIPAGGSSIDILALVNDAEITEMGFRDSAPKFKWAYKLKIENEDIGYNKHYLDQALSFFPNVTCYYKNSVSALRLENNQQIAVVMPCKLN